MSTTTQTQSSTPERMIGPPDEETKRTEPYSIWWHPAMFFLDIVVHYIFYFFAPCHKLRSDYDPANPSDTGKALLKKLRKNVAGAYDQASLVHINKWSQALECKIVQHSISIPLEADILEQWGIPLSNTARELLDTSQQANEGKCVKVLFTFPFSLLYEKEDVLEQKPGANGTYALKDSSSIDMAQFLRENAKTPVLVYVHGGGLTMGNNKDSVPFEFGCKPSIQAGGKPLIFASLAYGLAPEHPFPEPLQDLLQGIIYIIRALQQGSDESSFHIAGPSAGGYWATLLIMECQRKFPGFLKSALIMCPMIKPACDSVSYFVNTNLYFPSVDWLRWSWQVYLGFPWTKAGPFPLNLPLEEKRQFNSNKSSWDECPWRKDKVLERLIDPTLALPSNFSEDSSPHLLVTTNEGDPLRDDGYHLLNALHRANFPEEKLTHIQTKGSHHLGLMFDSKSRAMDQISNWWTDILFPAKHQSS